MWYNSKLVLTIFDFRDLYLRCVEHRRRPHPLQTYSPRSPAFPPFFPSSKISVLGILAVTIRVNPWKKSVFSACDFADLMWKRVKILTKIHVMPTEVS